VDLEHKHNLRRCRGKSIKEEALRRCRGKSIKEEEGRRMSKEAITTEWVVTPRAAYSQAIRSGDLVFVAGQGPLAISTAGSSARPSRPDYEDTLQTFARFSKLQA
jgi:hypothetical protein